MKRPFLFHEDVFKQQHFVIKHSQGILAKIGNIDLYINI